MEDFITPVTTAVNTYFQEALPLVAGTVAVLIGIPLAWSRVKALIKGA